MTDAWFERLTSFDATFLDIEDDATHMHVGAVIIFETGSLATDEGGVDIDRIRGFVESGIQRVARYRQRLQRVPMLNHPVWVDDHRFNIHYHVRHTALPRPGDERQLKRMAGRIFSQRLDRGRPLWEIWVVEGLTDDRFALISKVHHCMIDGLSGVDLIASLLRTKPTEEIPPIKPWEPRPEPTAAEMMGSEVRHRARVPGKLVKHLANMFADPEQRGGSAKKLREGLGDTVGASLVPASHTPLNTGRIGPHRRFDWTEMDLGTVKAVKNALGGKLNDVVLATVTGALRRFFDRRGRAPDAVYDFRIMVPVAVRTRDERGKLGNRVSVMLTHLPVCEADPDKRWTRIVEETRTLKQHTWHAEGADLVEEVGDIAGSGTLTQIAKMGINMRTYNLVVTNVPGPPFSLYLAGGKLQSIFPLVPLVHNQSLGVAIFSTGGRLCWGLNADWQNLPDLHDLIGDLHAAFEELREMAGVEAA